MKQAKWISVILTLALLASVFSLLPVVAETDGGADNTVPISTLAADGAAVVPGTVYAVATAEDLFTFAEVCTEANGYLAGVTVVLTADIDLNPGWQASAGKPDVVWSPIRLFSGRFDGQGHTLSGLYAEGVTGCTSNASEEVSGLFASIGGKDVTVQNLTIENSYFTSSKYTGGVVGVFASTLDNAGARISDVVSAATVVSGNGYASGIVAGIFSLVNNTSSVITIENCVFRGTAQVNDGGVGGIVAVTWRPIVLQSCVNLGTLLSEKTTTVAKGGIIARVSGGALFEMTGCANLADIVHQRNEDNGVNESGTAVGGLIGQYVAGAAAKVTDCINAGDISGGRNCVGGLVGSYAVAGGEFTRCLFTGTFAGGADYYSGGFIGQMNLSTANNEAVLTFTDCAYSAQKFQAYHNGKDYELLGTGIYAAANASMRNVRAVNTVTGQDVSVHRSELTSGAWNNNLKLNTAFSGAGCAQSADALAGMCAMAAQRALDWVNTWELTGEIPMPKGVAAILKAGFAEKDNGVDLLGVQNSATADGSFDVRMVATVDSLDYESVGFEVTFVYNDRVAAYTLDSATVYQKLTYGDLSEGAAEDTFFEVEGKWLCALAVRNVAAEGLFAMEITTFGVDSAGQAADDTAVYLFANGKFACSYWK